MRIPNLLLASGRAGWRLAACAMVLALLASSASAALITDSGFRFSISEKEMPLVHDFDPDHPERFDQEEYDEIMHYVGWDSSFQRVLDRNMPHFEISNNAVSSADIVEIRLTIGDTRYNFTNAMLGTFAQLATSDPGIGIASATSSGDQLIIKLQGDGIGPGQSARFKFKIGVDPNQPNLFPTPDFRRVMFDMNGTSMSDNSVVTVIYNDSKPNALSLALEDYDVNGPQANFFNQNYRPYSVMEGVDVFGGGVVVPEPTTAALVGAGLLGLIGVARRR